MGNKELLLHRDFFLLTIGYDICKSVYNPQLCKVSLITNINNCRVRIIMHLAQLNSLHLWLVLEITRPAPLTQEEALRPNCFRKSLIQNTAIA